MILVDTSLWVDHLHTGSPTLAGLLEDGAVLTHPCVVGELALGNLRNRAEVLTLLGQLPQATVAEHDEVLRLIEDEALHGVGIGYVDAHLLAASRLTPGARLWTADKRLASAASRLELRYQPTAGR